MGRRMIAAALTGRATSKLCPYHKRAATVEHYVAIVRSVMVDWQQANELVNELPARFERNIISQYTNRYRKNAVQANVGIRLVMSKLKRLKMPLSAISSDTMAASWGVEQCRKVWTNGRGNFQVCDTVIGRYQHVSEKARAAGFTPIGAERKKLTFEQCQLFTTQMLKESWWARQAKVAAARAREYIAISLGFVSKTADPYCSRETLQEWIKAQESSEQFLSSNFIGTENELDDELQIISLADAANASTSNPELRRLEMMARIRGIEEAAADYGWTATFITWTAPSVYHKNDHHWNGSDPRDTQRYMANQWKKARAEIKKAQLKMSGMRVAEPHNDATPHWHMLIFTPKRDCKPILKIMRKYAIQHYAQELKNGIKPRFHIERIKPSKGSAVAYIAKYISKSINGNHIEDLTDLETDRPVVQKSGKTKAAPTAEQAMRAFECIEAGKPVKYEAPKPVEEFNSAKAVRAWASRWGVRQFQFFGTPPVTVWREMRRLSDPLADEQAEAIRVSAGERGQKNATFRRFCHYMGGLCSLRAEQPIKVLSADNTNSYGEVKSRTVGLHIVRNGWEIITRKQWVKLGSAVSAFWRAQPVQRASGAARTRVNNCKSAISPDEFNEKTSMVSQVKKAVIGYFNRVGEWVMELIPEYGRFECENLTEMQG